MKSFLLNIHNKPIIPWGNLPDGFFYEGKIPENYHLAVCPGEYIVVDVDRHGDKDGFESIPENIFKELEDSFHYPTKNNGCHYWLKYTGNKTLLNKASGLGIDLRIGENENNGGYVKWHPRNSMDIREQTNLIQKSSSTMNNWLETLFS